MSKHTRPLKVPVKIQLAGQTIQCLWDPSLLTQECLGLACFQENEIRLQPHSDIQPRLRSQIEQTYLHELLHWALHVMGSEMKNQEGFIDPLAHLLHQAATSARGDLFRIKQ